MTSSNDGTVTGRPDETWRFVVEVPAPDNPKGDPDGKWVYTDVFDTNEEAIAACAGLEVCRVRAFRIQHMPQDYGIHPDVFTSRRINAPDVPLVDYTCATHRDYVVGVMQGGAVPRCKHCGGRMVPPAFAAKMAKAKDWTRK